MKKAVIILMFILFVQLVVSEEIQNVNAPTSTYTAEEQRAIELVNNIYSNNLVCEDSDGMNYEVKGETKQSVDANIIERLIIFIRNIFNGISNDEIDEAFRKINGEDNCDGVGSSKDLEVNAAIQRYGDKLWLRELYCDGNQVKFNSYQCPNGCNDGRCIGNDENIKPEREIFWVTIGTNEDSYSWGTDALNVPIGLIFVTTQNQYNDLLNPNIISPKDKKKPEFYIQYPIFTIKDVDQGLINLGIENLGVNNIKLEQQHPEIIKDYEITNVNGNGIIVKYIGTRANLVLPVIEK